MLFHDHLVDLVIEGMDIMVNKKSVLFGGMVIVSYLKLNSIPYLFR